MKLYKRKFHFNSAFTNEEERKNFGAICLYQIGDLYSEKEYECPSHINPCHEITYVVSGAGLCTFNNKAYRVKEGDIFLSPKGSEHRLRSNAANPMRYYYCGFFFDREHPDYPHFAQLEKLFETLQHPLATNRYSLDMVFTLLLREMNSTHPNHAMLMQAGLTQLLLLTQQCFEKSYVATDKWTSFINQSKRQVLTRDAMNYIDSHVTSIKKLTEVSERLGYSYSYLTQAFSSTMNISLNDYYREQRMRKAVELLKKGVSVTQVSDTLGFNSVQAFSRSFKSFYGVTPSKYELGKKK